MTHDYVASAIERIIAAERALVLGIGGGGDVVGALAVARLCESVGTPFEIGGTTWERYAIDPYPGPRPSALVDRARPLGEGALLARAETTTADGTAFAESGMAAHLGTDTVLIDLTGGTSGAAAGIESAARALECDLVVGLDVGGDVLARGSEPGLQSPLCDAVMVAAMLDAGDRGIKTLLGVIGAGCDGELTVAQVVERVADLGRGRAWVGTWSPTREIAEELRAAATAVPTEASLQVARCALGEVGEALIRQGRRRVELGPVGALAFFFDTPTAAEDLPLALAVRETESIEEARAALADLGVRTELDYERERAAEARE